MQSSKPNDFVPLWQAPHEAPLSIAAWVMGFPPAVAPAFRMLNAFGWQPVHGFTAGLDRTVEWYLEHRLWCETVQQGRYGRERLGLSG
mgnify:CR=1 FL=1